MKKRKVVSTKNLPIRLPVLFTVVVLLLLDKYNPTGVVWGVVVTLVVIIWVVCAISIHSQEQTEIFKDENKN